MRLPPGAPFATAGVSAATAASAALRASRGAVSRASGGGVLKTAARVELLLAGSPNELLPAVPAGQGLVLKAHVGSLQSSQPTSRFHASQGAIPSLGPTREP